MTRSDSPQFSRWVHVTAVGTALTALLPIALGAQTTTKNAGMAFPDWPTSDGHGMLTYPWLASTGAKFLEHGHRLAGVAIGIASLLLAATLFAKDRRAWVRAMGAGVVLAVIGQGVLGGQRVLLDARGLAFIHGSTAALVFSYMWGLVVATSRGWFEVDRSGECDVPPRWMAWLALSTYLAVYLQYVLGGLVRHQGMALTEHLVFAFVAALLVVVTSVAAGITGHPWLRGPAAACGVCTLVQLVLGAGTWITKFGFNDRVAVYGSTEQIVFRTSHVLNGMLLFAAVSVLTFRMWRLQFFTPALTGSHTTSAAGVALDRPARETVALPAGGAT